MLCLRNLYHKKHWAQQGSKPGSFTHSTDYIHILRRNHLVEEINMKEAAANPLCNLAREAPRAWEIKTPLAVEILPVNYLHPPLGVALAYFLLVSFLHFRCQPGEQNWTSGCLLYKLIFMKAQQPFLGFFLMELPGDRDLFCSTWLKRKALTGCLCTRTWCCRQLTAQTTNVQGPSTQCMSWTQGNTWRRYAVVQDIRSVACALRFLTQNLDQTHRMPAGICMHTPADFSSSLASWGPTAPPNMLAFETSSTLNTWAFSVPQIMQRSFCASASPEGIQGHRSCTQSLSQWQSQARSTWFPPLASSSISPPSPEFATLPTLPTHNPIFQTQPIKLTSDLPCSCAWHAGSSSRTRGSRRFASLQESTAKEKCEESHVLGGS